MLLNDLDSDPSRLLAAKLDSVTATERTVRATAFVLLPLGLGGVAACGWMLSVYRRRSEAVMFDPAVVTAFLAALDSGVARPDAPGSPALALT